MSVMKNDYRTFTYFSTNEPSPCAILCSGQIVPVEIHGVIGPAVIPLIIEYWQGPNPTNH